MMVHKIVICYGFLFILRGELVNGGIGSVESSSKYNNAPNGYLSKGQEGRQKDKTLGSSGEEETSDERMAPLSQGFPYPVPPQGYPYSGAASVPQTYPYTGAASVPQAYPYTGAASVPQAYPYPGAASTSQGYAYPGATPAPQGYVYPGTAPISQGYPYPGAPVLPCSTRSKPHRPYARIGDPSPEGYLACKQLCGAKYYGRKSGICIQHVGCRCFHKNPLLSPLWLTDALNNPLTSKDLSNPYE